MKLTAHQRAIVELVAADQGDKAIADRLSISVASVKTTLYRLRRRHGLNTRMGLGLVYLESKVKPKLSFRARRELVKLSHELDGVC